MTEAPPVLHVACVVEGDYVVHSAAMLHSVLRQRGRHGVHVHYVHGPDLPAGPRGPLAEMVERDGGRISFVEVPDELCRGLPTEGFTGKATWYRIFVPDLLPDLDRVLVLDCDLLALAPLEPLWETDLSEHHLAAVTNVFQADHLFRAGELGFDRPQEYFNAGVLLMNLARMRRDGLVAALRDYGTSHADSLMFRDQDALNAVLAGGWRPLHPRWNVMNSFEVFPWSAYVFGNQALDAARRDPAIRHFEGPGANKPWHRQCRASQRELYFEHRRQTPWPEVDMVDDGVPPAGIVRRAARRLRRGVSA